MDRDRLRECDERFRTAHRESDEHLWAKVELHRRKQAEVTPFFEGEYQFEKTVADRVPDCFVMGGPVNRWIEFVAGSPQEYREKTREALRLGFVIHWVFLTGQDEQRRAAEEALAPELHSPFQFGEYDPERDVLDLGDPVTYKNYEFTVEEMSEFRPRELLGYRAGAARIGGGSPWFDLGLFDVAGYQYRLVSFNPQGTYFRTVIPGQPDADMPWGWPTVDGLKELVAAGKVTRLGPVNPD